VASLGEHVFPWINDLALGRRMEPLRQRSLAGLAGRVLEIGAGSGLNFRHYPAGVEVSAIEPSPMMLRRAEARRSQAGAAIALIEGRAGALPFPDASFDAAIVTFTLCSIRDVAAALAEVRRVLRPGGELRVLEHVVSPSPARARIQRVMEPAWNLAFGGCSLLRDARAELARAGFDPGAIEAVALPLPFPVGEGVIGAAVRR
jgi:SAM-dependent methyltransferase